MSAHSITLPRITIQSFDPTADEAGDKRKGAAGGAARPVGETMLATSTERHPAPQATIINREVGTAGDADRAHAHAEEWLRVRIELGRHATISEESAVTPQIAAALLKRNPENRNISKKRVAEIRADLESGRYALNGEPIIVSKDGLLNDGQHRLMACVESGVAFRTMVVFGVARSSRLTLDQGGARTVSDYLDMQGDTEHTKVAATVGRMLCQYGDAGKISQGSSGPKKKSWPTKAQQLAMVHQCDREIQRGIQTVKQSSKLVGSFSFIVFCHIVLSRADESMGPIFIERLLDGADLRPDNPIFLVRERFINDPKMSQTDRFEAIVRAWNAIRKGKTLGKIQIMGNVPKVEA